MPCGSNEPVTVAEGTSPAESPASDIRVIPVAFEGRGRCSYCGGMKPMAARLRVTDAIGAGMRLEAVACAVCYEDTEQLFDQFYKVARPNSGAMPRVATLRAATGKTKR